MSFNSETSPLESYNSLHDRHLINYFRSARMRKHLIRTGLLKENGEIRPESEYKELRMRENQRRALMELIAQVIVERSLEAERQRQGKIRRTLEEICKLHRVRQIKEERRKREAETLLMQLIPHVQSSREKLDPLPITVNDASIQALLNNGDFYLTVSDIDDPDVAVLDRQSRVEVTKLRRIYNKQRNRQRKSGQPPYLYLNEPGIGHFHGPKSTPKKVKKKIKSKGHGDISTGVKSKGLGTSPSTSSAGSNKETTQRIQGNQGDRLLPDERILTLKKCPNQSLPTNHSSPSYSTPSPAGITKSEQETIKKILFASTPKFKSLERQYVGNGKGLQCDVSPSLLVSAKSAPQAILLRSETEKRAKFTLGSRGVAYGHNLKSRPPERQASPQIVTSMLHSVERKPPIIIPEPVRMNSDDEDDNSVASNLPPISDKQVVSKTSCVVKLMYLGDVNANENFPGSKKKNSHPISNLSPKRWITVIQQPSGGNTITVFKGLLKPGDVLEFNSRRVHGFPFSLLLCVDGAHDTRVSTCCEYRYKKGVRIGGKSGRFVYLDAQGSMPCFKCQSMRTANVKTTADTRLQTNCPVAGDDSCVEGAECKTSQQFEPDPDLLTDSLALDSNVSRRLAKSTRWECFRTMFHPTEEAETEQATNEDTQLNYGVEEVQNADEVEPLSETHESVSHLLPATESDDLTTSPTSNHAVPDYEADEIVYDEEFEEEDADYQDDDGIADDALNGGELSAKSVHNYEQSDDPFNKPRGDFITTNSSQCAVVGKADTLFLGCMVSVTPSRFSVDHFLYSKEIGEDIKNKTTDSPFADMPHTTELQETICDGHTLGRAQHSLLRDYSSIQLNESGNVGNAVQQTCIVEDRSHEAEQRVASKIENVARSSQQFGTVVQGDSLNSFEYEHVHVSGDRRATYTVTLDSSAAQPKSIDRLTRQLDVDTRPIDSGIHFGDELVACASLNTAELDPNHINILPTRKSSIHLPENVSPDVYQLPDRDVPQITQTHIPLAQSPIHQSVSDETGHETVFTKPGIADTKYMEHDVAQMNASKPKVIKDFMHTPSLSTEVLGSEYEPASEVYESASDVTLRSLLNTVREAELDRNVLNEAKNT